MFTQKSIIRIIAFMLLTVVAFGNFGPDVARAADPDKVTTDANAYISYLDNLRDMGQTEAQIAQARHARDVAVFDHSSYLVSLHNRVIDLRIDANRPTIGDATAYISHLEQLRAIGNAPQTDANGFISHLDQLRYKGFDTSEVGTTALVSQ